MAFQINRTVALVTGANRGIGRALVKGLLDAGAAKVYAGARNPAALADLVKEAGPRVVPIMLDVTSDADVAAAARQAGDINLLINNAGVAGYTAGLEPNALASARHEMEVNYFGLLRVTTAFAPILKQQGGGTVANIASIASLINFPALGTYSASKAAAWSLSYALRAALAPQATRLIIVYPGPIDTAMAEQLPLEKAPTSVVVDALLTALSDGTDEIFPDPISKDLYARWAVDHRAVQQEMLTPQPV